MWARTLRWIQLPWASHTPLGQQQRPRWLWTQCFSLPPWDVSPQRLVNAAGHQAPRAQTLTAPTPRFVSLKLCPRFHCFPCMSRDASSGKEMKLRFILSWELWIRKPRRQAPSDYRHSRATVSAMVSGAQSCAVFCQPALHWPTTGAPWGNYCGKTNECCRNMFCFVLFFSPHRSKQTKKQNTK